MQALERANRVRLARAELKRRIAEGEISAADLMLRLPPEADNWTVRELLLSQRRWGSTRARRFLERNQIGELKRLGELTDRQRRLLAAQLQGGSTSELVGPARLQSGSTAQAIAEDSSPIALQTD